jgi:MFS family permease
MIGNNGVSFASQTKEIEANKDLKWNFTMGLIHGIAYNSSMAFYSPNIILPLFLDQFQLSRVLIGLFATVLGHHGGGIFGGIPQLFVANLLENKKRKKPLLIFATVMRTLSWFLIAALTFFIAVPHPSLMLWSFLFLLILFTFMGGVSSVPLLDIWGKAIPSSMRGRFMGDRYFWGSLIAVGTAFIAKNILTNKEILFPNNFALLFLLAAVTMGIGYIGLGAVREPVEEVHKERQPVNNYMKKVLQTIRDDLNFRRFLIIEILVEAGALSLPFYVLYAKHDLNISTAVAGLLIFSQMIGEICSNLIWAFLADKMGNKKIIQICTCVSFLVPVGILLTPSSFPYLLFPLFILIGFSLAGLKIGKINFVFDIAPQKERVTYISISGTFKMPTMIFPLIGGALAQATSYPVLFMVTAVLILFAFTTSMKLEEPGKLEQVYGSGAAAHPGDRFRSDKKSRR